MTNSIRLTTLAVMSALIPAFSGHAIVGGFVPANDEYRFDAVAAFGKTNLLDPCCCGAQCAGHSWCGTLIDCE
jgi:hypothetical protein